MPSLPSEARPSSLKKFLPLLIKAGIALAIFAWVWTRGNSARLWSCLSTAHWDFAAAAAALLFATLPVAGFRWRRLLLANGINVPFMSLLLTSHIGQLFTLFLPGPLGDDSIRLLYVSKLAPNRTANALSSVLLDRCLGLLGILLVAVACLPQHWATLAAHSLQTRWLAGAFLLAALGASLVAAILFTTKPERLLQTSNAILQKLPGERLPEGLEVLLKTTLQSRKSLPSVLSAACLTQVLVCGSFYFAGRSVDIDLPFSVWLSFVPIILGANSIPITLAGIGVRDYLMVLFLQGLAGVESAQALAASLVILGVSVLLSLSGGLSYLCFSPQNRQTPPVPSSTPPPEPVPLDSLQ